MVPVAPDRASTAERTVDGSSDPDGGPLEAAHEPRVPFGFDEEVKVVGLDAEVEEAKAMRRAGREGVAHDRKHGCFAERGETASCSERDVYGTARSVRGPWAMWDRPAARPWHTPGALATATPRTYPKFELRAGCHLDWGR